MADSKKYTFKAEVSQLLHILTHSLYSHRDIFIRELISNAADALDKVRFLEVKGEKVNDPDSDLAIHIEVDKEAKTLTLRDTGIGMTLDELRDNIGTIARSGTADFLSRLGESKEDPVSLIGKFGVGFYSVFMAAEKVELVTRAAQGDEPAYCWTSDGQSDYRINPLEEKTPRGTSVKVFLREDAEEFTDPERIRSAVQTYSNFVPFPINLNGEKINTISAIWREPKSSVKKKSYVEFFKFIAGQQEEPLNWFHLSADVPIQFNALLFIPKTNMEMLGFSLRREGVHLFVKRVMVDSDSKDVLPHYLRFLEGVVESDELPLNVSRETLQENPYLIKIRNTLTGKFISHLQDLSEKDPEIFLTIWKTFGRILKEGYSDFTHKDKLSELFRYETSRSDGVPISLKTYTERMKPGQNTIYYLSGSDRSALSSHPALEMFKAKNLEVIYCFDPVDEFALPGLMTYAEKKIQSADRVDPKDLEKIEDETETPKKKISDAARKNLEALTRRMKNILGDKVEDVALSDRLVDSPAILVGSNKGLSSQMEKIMSLMNESKVPPRLLEINAHHSMIRHLSEIYQKNPKDKILTRLVEGLYHTARLLDGTVDDPRNMAEALQELLAETARLSIKEKEVLKKDEQKNES
ncbi:MAG TPA: molecular chaperone HtpG [bacterium]|nr:molecular chaperone HtpG [bacterium]